MVAVRAPIIPPLVILLIYCVLLGEWVSLWVDWALEELFSRTVCITVLTPEIVQNVRKASVSVCIRYIDLRMLQTLLQSWLQAIGSGQTKAPCDMQTPPSQPQHPQPLQWRGKLATKETRALQPVPDAAETCSIGRTASGWSLSLEVARPPANPNTPSYGREADTC